MLAYSPAIDKYDLSSLDKISSGGSALLSADREACVKRFAARGWKVSIAQGFGMTELSPVMCIDPTAEYSDAKCKSVGCLLPNTLVRVVDDKGRSLGVDEDGEILVRGPQVMVGYRYAAGELAAAACIEDGWFRTGDIGHFDKDGFYYITDRLKELIKYKGYQVPLARHSARSAERGAEAKERRGVRDCAHMQRQQVSCGRWHRRSSRRQYARWPASLTVRSSACPTARTVSCRRRTCSCGRRLARPSSTRRRLKSSSLSPPGSLRTKRSDRPLWLRPLRPPCGLQRVRRRMDFGWRGQWATSSNGALRIS